MNEWHESLGHLMVGITFITLVIYQGYTRRYLHRESTFIRLSFPVVLTVAMVSLLANLIWLLSEVLQLNTPPFVDAWVRILSYTNILLMAFVSANHIGTKKLSSQKAARRILAIGAHPDDLSLACGGTLARLVEEGHIVHGLILSRRRWDGNNTSQLLNADHRELISGFYHLTFLDLPDISLMDEFEAISRTIESKVHSFCPDIILTHSEHEQEPDRQVIHYATMRAGQQVNTILCYESSTVSSDFKPNLFIEIGPYMDAKIESIRERTAPFVKTSGNDIDVRARARTRGEQARTQYAEGFEIRRALMTEGGTI